VRGKPISRHKLLRSENQHALTSSTEAAALLHARPAGLWRDGNDIQILRHMATKVFYGDVLHVRKARVQKTCRSVARSLGRSDDVHMYSPDGSKEWPRGRKARSPRDNPIINP
jgi:hypothetical protein